MRRQEIRSPDPDDPRSIPRRRATRLACPSGVPAHLRRDGDPARRVVLVHRAIWWLLHHHGVGDGVLHWNRLSAQMERRMNAETYVAGSGGSMGARAPESAWAASRAEGRRRWAGDMCPGVGVACMLAGLRIEKCELGKVMKERGGTRTRHLPHIGGSIHVWRRHSGRIRHGLHVWATHVRTGRTGRDHPRRHHLLSPALARVLTSVK